MSAARLPRQTPRLALPVAEAALAIGCSVTKFEGLVESGAMPPPYLIGTKRVWSVAELEAALHALPQPDQSARVPAEKRGPRAI